MLCSEKTESVNQTASMWHLLYPAIPNSLSRLELSEQLGFLGLQVQE